MINAITRPDSRAVDGFLERLDADAPIRVDEPLVVLALHEIRVDDLPDRTRHFDLRQPRPESVAERCLLIRRTAERELEELLAAFIDAQNADVADMVVAAGVHATRDVDREMADPLQLIEIAERAADVLRDRNRARVRERAVVEARAADDVGQKP